MLLAIAMATRCALGSAVQARFLLAMCKECRHQRITWCAYGFSRWSGIWVDWTHPCTAPDMQSPPLPNWDEDSDYK